MKFTTSLTKNHIFQRLYHKGNKQVTPFLAMYVMKNYKSMESQNILGLTVGVKVGNAVTRNKIKRRLRELYRTHEHELKSGYQIVIVARNRCSTAKFSQLEQSFLLLCDQLDLSLTPKHPVKFISQGKPQIRKNSNPNQGRTQAQSRNKKPTTVKKHTDET